MFGSNAQGWLALHRQQHAELVAVARPARAPRVMPAARIALHAVAARRAPQAVAAAACAPC